MPIINMVYKKKKGWQPGANTLAYWKFNNNLTDETGNMTATGSNLAYGTVGNYHYIKNTATGFSPVITVSGNGLSQIGSGGFCISMYLLVPTTATSNYAQPFGEWYDASNPYPGPQLRFDGANGNLIFFTKSGVDVTTSLTKGVWHNVICTRNNGTISMYIDGQSVGTPYTDTTNFSSGSSHKFFMMGRTGWSGGTMPVTGFRMSEVIYEKQGWDATTSLNYYNSTKGNYGL